MQLRKSIDKNSCYTTTKLLLRAKLTKNVGILMKMVGTVGIKLQDMFLLESVAKFQNQ